MSAPNADISGDLLFPVAESLSPRLAWMRKHGVITFSLDDDTWLAGFQAWHPTVTDAAQFFCDETGCNGDTRIGEGDTESDAMADLLNCWYARERNIQLWNEEAGV